MVPVVMWKLETTFNINKHCLSVQLDQSYAVFHNRGDKWELIHKKPNDVNNFFFKNKLQSKLKLKIRCCSKTTWQRLSKKRESPNLSRISAKEVGWSF